MIVSLSLEHPHTNYTNLDVISGKVYLRVPNPGHVSSIVVKLEGESRTRLMAALRPDRPERQRPVLEVHKILYRTQVVWPANMLPQDVATSKASFSLNAGQYEYPFQFKMPINNACVPNTSMATNVNFAGMALEVARPPTQHVKQTLPPSLSGFPGEAEIRYYVKVTVNRPQFFKENPRSLSPFTFLPIEPPKPARADGEAYARRQHDGVPAGPAVPAVPAEPTAGSTPPRFTVDARLPNPAILTCNKDMPLRILVKNMSPRGKHVYLQMLQIELIGYTKVRAHDVERTESNSWIVASMSNMAIPLGSPSDPIGTEVPINREYWADKTLPNTVAPSFQTCNISRFYELEIRVGLGYGSYEHGSDQLVVLPLRLPVKVYSGIAPPKALLDATQQQQQGMGMGMGPAPGMGMGHPPPPVPYDDAPPSYEDAIGQDLPPIDGYRGNYQPPPVPEGAPRWEDDKRRG
ncbi:arrestin [Amniculicola lignicola CBS 123094]|uniref:Arrestin n=1 Tax=Amniculicola lignicola CBS 123094 TaxID=1392246 RepID=A0A6A5W408_9PLEO|nr:arrestin [Amniculicola lignicola CBS 123094]